MDPVEISSFKLAKPNKVLRALESCQGSSMGSKNPGNSIISRQLSRQFSRQLSGLPRGDLQKFGRTYKAISPLFAIKIFLIGLCCTSVAAAAEEYNLLLRECRVDRNGRRDMLCGCDCEYGVHEVRQCS